MNFQLSTDTPGIPGIPHVTRLHYTSDDGHDDWALLEPPRGGTTWAVYLHGHGSTGDQLFTRPDIRDVWLPVLRQRGLGILSPTLRGNAWMSPAAVRDLHQLLAWLRQTHQADRIVLIGASMGGTGVLIYAGLHPEDIAAAVALCPTADIARYHAWCRSQNSGPAVLEEIADAIEAGYAGPAETLTARLTAHSACGHCDRLTMPLAIAHGDADAIIPATQSRQLAATLAERATCTYLELPGGGHDAPIAHFPQTLAHVLR